jgi:hypothetical protein
MSATASQIRAIARRHNRLLNVLPGRILVSGLWWSHRFPSKDPDACADEHNHICRKSLARDRVPKNSLGKIFPS